MLYAGRITRRRLDGTLETTDDRPLAVAQAERVAAIKETARARIVALCPEWRQTNLVARGTELLLRIQTGGAALSPAELAEIAAANALWAAIKAIRVASNDAEAAVMAATTNDAADAVAF
jgi:hypothetical protein